MNCVCTFLALYLALYPGWASAGDKFGERRLHKGRGAFPRLVLGSREYQWNTKASGTQKALESAKRS
ncbi:exported hypothetical protein [Pseudomonas marginalis]